MAKLLFSDHSSEWKNGGDFPRIPLTKVSWDTAPDTAVAYVFFGHVNIDFDGSPTAYGPPGITPPPDDNLSNAGDDDQGWYGLFAVSENDPLVKNGTVIIDKNPALLKKGKYPVIQQASNGDPSPGYYVSTTPRPRGPGYLQNSYVDASQYAFGALSGRLQALGFDLGDFGLAVRHDQGLQSVFYFLDKGGNNYKLGECSHKVGKNLGGSGRGNSFNNNYPVSFIVFPASRTQEPDAVAGIEDADIKTALQPLLANLATATNAEDLALLMGFNEVGPPTKPQGTAKLGAYQQKPGSAKPKNHGTIVQGLQAFGFAITIASADDSAPADSSDAGTSPEPAPSPDVVASADNSSSSGDASEPPPEGPSPDSSSSADMSSSPVDSAPPDMVASVEPTSSSVDASEPPPASPPPDSSSDSPEPTEGTGT